MVGTYFSKQKIFLIGLFLIIFSTAKATVYYSDPIIGNMSNSGTAASPWGNLEAIFNNGQTFIAGDTIYLRTGNHVYPKINGLNSDYVDILPEPGHNPMIYRMEVGQNVATSFWRFSNLTIEYLSNSLTGAFPLVRLHSSTSNIIIQNCTIQSTANTAAFSRDDWRDKMNKGIFTSGSNHIIQNNVIRNIQTGIDVRSEYTLVKNNTIQNFTKDGMFGLASYCTYEKNSILDAIIVYPTNWNLYPDGHHYDLFQSWTSGGDTLRDVIIRQNTLIGSTDPNRDFWYGTCQGMGFFDGFYEDWIVENNLIVVDHWHGISFYGAINCKILNNTVVDPYDSTAIDPFEPPISGQTTGSLSVGPAWIQIKNHKDTTLVSNLSYGNVIRNNLIGYYISVDSNVAVIDNNILLSSSSNYPSHFVDYLGFDYSLIDSSTAINSGSSLLAPNVDFDGVSRPQGLGYDIGAFEYLFLDVFTTIDTTLCNGESVSIGSTAYSSSGTYIDTLNSGFGYDSTITLILAITSIDVSTTTSNETIMANQTGAIYQWIDCDNGNMPIVGETNQSFTATTNGNYAVVVSLDSCSETSSCVTISALDISENTFGNNILLYPNPTTDLVTIELKEPSSVQITITDLSGKIYYTNSQIDDSILNISMKAYLKGVYLLSVVSGENEKVFKLIKQ